MRDFLIQRHCVYWLKKFCHEFMLKLARRLLGEPCAGEVALTLAGARFWEASSLGEDKSFMLLFSLFLSTIFYSDVAVNPDIIFGSSHGLRNEVYLINDLS